MKKLLKKILRNLGFKLVRYESLPYNKRILDTYRIIEKINFHLDSNSVSGIFVECGFGYGRSFVIMSHFSEKSGRRIIGFDSFEGFPELHANDKSPRNAKKREWSVMNLKEANKLIRGSGLFTNNDNYKLIKILFNKKSKNPIPHEEIAFLHIDLDLYEGYKFSLEMFWDQVTNGGVILLDEYNEEAWPGATQAVNEFLKKKGIQSNLVKIDDKFCIFK